MLVYVNNYKDNAGINSTKLTREKFTYGIM